MEEKHRDSAVTEKEIAKAIKKGIKAPRIKVVARLLLATLVIASLATFITGIIRYNEIQREAEALEEKIEEREGIVERLEYFLDAPVDYDYIVQMAKEKLNLFLPNEIIFNNDTNK